MKQTDSRINDFKLEYIACFKAKYKIEPSWNAKHAKHAQSMWKVVDRNKLEQSTVYEILHSYFACDDAFIRDDVRHDAVYFCNHFEKMYLKFKKIEAPKPGPRVFYTPDTDMARSMEEWLDTHTEVSFVKAMKWQSQNVEMVKLKVGPAFEHWKKAWMMGCKKWGSERLKQLFHGEEELHKASINEQLKKAKEIELSPIVDKTVKMFGGTVTSHKILPNQI